MPLLPEQVGDGVVMDDDRVLIVLRVGRGAPIVGPGDHQGVELGVALIDDPVLVVK